MKPELKIFLEAVKKETNIDDDALEAVKEIHETIYEDDDSDEDEEKKEPEEEESDNDEEPAEDGETEVEEADEETEPSEDDTEDEDVTLLHNVLATLLEKRNAYQTYHWNTDVASLHTLAEDAYDLYQDTADAIAEALVGNYEIDINANVWHDVPALDSKQAFINSLKEDYDKFCSLRDQLEQYKLFGVNSLLDGFIEKLTTIKYKAVSFYNGNDDD